MRADRLLAIIMYLQNNRRMTASALSRELEVTERTIYRDMVALNTAGIPVYAVKGPKGGFSLIEDFKTTLTGLTEEEVKTLFMLDIPPQLIQLGLDQKAKLALLKLSAALPASKAPLKNLLDQKFLFDPDFWYHTLTPIPYLQTIHHALWNDHRLKIVYKLPFDVTREWVVEPYGLVSKENNWYLVCNKNGNQMRVLYISRILEAKVLDEVFSRNKAFNLGAFWKKWCKEYEGKHLSYPVIMRIKKALLPGFRKVHLVEILRNKESCDQNGWWWVKINFKSLNDARQNLLGYGNSIEVIEPKALRLSIADFAEQIINLYKKSK